jgi:hypothetical protein
MQYFLTKVLNLRRLRAIDANRSAYSATGTADGYPISMQEPAPDMMQMYDGQIGNMWMCYVQEDCFALEGDQVVILGVKYSVKSVKVMDFGSQYYRRLTLIKYGNN